MWKKQAKWAMQCIGLLFLDAVMIQAACSVFKTGTLWEYALIGLFIGCPLGLLVAHIECGFKMLRKKDE